MEIDKKTHQISGKNHYKTQTTKSQIVIGISLRKDSNHISRLRHKDFGLTKKWNTYTISRDGTIYQHYDDKYYSDFLNIKPADKQSISIVLENMGCLSESMVPSNRYVNWLNEYCDKESVIEKKYFGFEYWEKFPEIQIENLVLLCRVLCEKHGISKNFIEFQDHNNSVSKYKGILFRSNYIESSSDINPLFKIEMMDNMLNETL